MEGQPEARPGSLVAGGAVGTKTRAEDGWVGVPSFCAGLCGTRVVPWGTHSGVAVARACVCVTF